MKNFSKTNINNNKLNTNKQTKTFTLKKIHNTLNQQINQHIKS